MKRGFGFAALLLAGLFVARPAGAQNPISQDGWEGFVVRNADNKFDRCVLYNRTIPALNSSPYEMLGLTRDAAGHIGLLIFYAPRALTRGDTTVLLKLDKRLPLTLAGEALSDFHVNITGPLDTATLAALREVKAIEATVEGKTIRFKVSRVGAVLDRLASCVESHRPKS